MIVIENVKKEYRLGKIRVNALRGVDLKISKGEMVVVGGPSGSGKSTMLNLIGAMDTPDSGSLTIEGEKISCYSKAQLAGFRRRKIGFIFQNFHLVASLNVYENIIIPMHLKRQSYNKREIISLIERVGLLSHINHRPEELSGGQRQRVAIARALAHKPPIILADEPTANLDNKTSRDITALLKELNSELNVTVLIASHDQWIMQKVERKLILVDGVITSDKKE